MRAWGGRLFIIADRLLVYTQVTWPTCTRHANRHFPRFQESIQVWTKRGGKRLTKESYESAGRAGRVSIMMGFTGSGS